MAYLVLVRKNHPQRFSSLIDPARLTYILIVLTAALLGTAACDAQHMNKPGAPCQNSPGTPDAVACFDKHLKLADRKLNVFYARVLAVLKPEDRQNLKQAQRLWLQFRDSDCNAEQALYGLGTGAGPAHLACLEAQTRQRTSDLHSIYDWQVVKFEEKKTVSSQR